MTVKVNPGRPSDVRVGRVAESGSNGQQVIESTATVDVLHTRRRLQRRSSRAMVAAQVGQSAPAAALPPGVDIFVENATIRFHRISKERDQTSLPAQRKLLQRLRRIAEAPVVTAGVSLPHPRAMGSDTGNFGVGNVAQVDSNQIERWLEGSTQISAHDIHIAEIVVDHGGDAVAAPGGYPTPQYHSPPSAIIRSSGERPQSAAA